METAYQITFIYRVKLNEEKLLKGSPEEITRLQRLLKAAQSNQQILDYLMLREIAFNLADIGEREQMPEVLTGYEIGDYSPIQNLVKTLSNEDQEYLTDSNGSYVEDILSDTIKAELDHTHVQRLDTQSEEQPTVTKKRHHKRNTR